ncbi:hypothetical protein VNO77_00881 [Canavalia gladiata]|uniref:Uncharacterized protein n=1 Tax=Canavalia gladiata TaxID=3824 RepID=A0AAN9R1R4_CANGL
MPSLLLYCMICCAVSIFLSEKAWFYMLGAISSCNTMMMTMIIKRIMICVILLNPLYWAEVACAFTLCEDLVKGEGNRKRQSRKSKVDSCVTLIERKRICLPSALLFLLAPASSSVLGTKCILN